MTIPHPLAINFLRRRLRPESERIRRGKYVHLTRGKMRAINDAKQKEFHDYLESMGFDIVEPGSMSTEAQRELFKDVEILSAEGGAALSNMLYCPEGCKIIVIASSNHVYEIWSVIAAELGQHLWMCLEEETHLYPNPFHLWCNLEGDLNLDTFKSCLRQALKTDA